jgi:hypothetical protein
LRAERRATTVETRDSALHDDAVNRYASCIWQFNLTASRPSERRSSSIGRDDCLGCALELAPSLVDRNGYAYSGVGRALFGAGMDMKGCQTLKMPAGTAFLREVE